MSIRLDLGKILFLVLLLTLTTMAVMADNVKGRITDRQTGEPLPGATVQVEGTAQGAVSNVDGLYTLSLRKGTYTLTVSYVGYRQQQHKGVRVAGETVLDFALEVDAQTLNEVSVVAQKKLEGEHALQAERQKASFAIENMGAKEMNLKGISNVEEGVKKLSGISVAGAGQLIVRGLGDRYSHTTLNGLPIASPNPDNKLIPLDLFPSATVEHITVSKVYEPSAFADYSGAHIDINTREQVSEDFLQVGFRVGGAFNTLGHDRLQMDRDGSLFSAPSIDPKALTLNLTDFDSYVLERDIFRTSFDVSRKSSMPDMGGTLSMGKQIELGGQKLSLLLAGNLNNSYQRMTDAFFKTLEATGNVQSDFAYDSYAQTLKCAALGSIGYTLGRSDRIGYTFFYSRNATDTYQYRQGVDAEDHRLTGSNSVTHIYTLQNHQLNAQHHFGAGDLWTLTYGGSYSKTSSQEPDRRQVMFLHDEEGTMSLFKLNRQETMRYFGSLDEKEWNAYAVIRRKWGEENGLELGANYKDKNRDYQGTRFYYNVNRLNPTITSPFDTSDYLNQSQVANGTLVIERKMQPKDCYLAGHRITAAYLQGDFRPWEPLFINLGLRWEHSQQHVNYATDGGEKYAERRDLNGDDLFPALNLKYQMPANHTLRLALSRTVTRPSFIEMAPFLYQESYGAAQIRGNGDLKNGYNYNFDLRYEWFGKQDDMISVTGYFKHLDNPIERVQGLNGGATVHTFQNADNGLAAGAELELRKQLPAGFRLMANVSYMYTNVKLPEGGAYTNKERSLQGASPILANADLTWMPRLGGDRQLSLALLYNLQGKRIHAVGVSGLGDVKQDALHTLNFNAQYRCNRHLSLSLQLSDLLNRNVTFRQDIPTTGQRVVVEQYREGTSMLVGATYRF